MLFFFNSDKAPGQSECEAAAVTLTNHLRALDSAYMEAVSQTLAPRKGSSLPIYNQQVGRAAGELQDSIEPLRQSAKYEAEHIGHAVNQMVCLYIILNSFLISKMH